LSVASRVYESDSPTALAQRLTRESEVEALALGELLEERIEAGAILGGDDRHRVRRLDGVGIALADDNLGAQGVHHPVKLPVFQHPRRELHPRGWPIPRSPQIDERHRIA